MQCVTLYQALPALPATSYWPVAYPIYRSVCLCLCVCRSVCLKSVLWQNCCMDLDAVWDGDWGRSSEGCIRCRWWISKAKGQFWGWIGGVPL